MLPRRRHRRFPERDLLNRLRLYESLLRKNEVPFDSLFQMEDGETGGAGSDDGGEGRGESATSEANPSQNDNVDDEIRVPALGAASGPPPENHPGRPVRQLAYDSKSSSFLKAIKRFDITRDNDHGHENEDGDTSEEEDGAHSNALRSLLKKKMFNSSRLLFPSSSRTTISMALIHPAPAQLFRLWQVYLDNVDPLLKVTHTPTLQGRVVEAAGKLAGTTAGSASNIDPSFEALLFSIYCIAIYSMTPADCQTTFSTTKDTLLGAYQSACEQALLNAGLLQTAQRDCLTAFLFYLMSLGHSLDPKSLFSMLGIAVRIGQRMQLDNEIAEAKLSPLEAELRRRLWWTIALFDARIGEVAAFRSGSLEPTWNCSIPLNVNDSAFRVELKEPPTVQGHFSEALFAVVRCEVGNFVRHAPFFLTFSAPALACASHTTDAGGDGNARVGGSYDGKPSSPDFSDLDILEQKIHNNYLRHCDPSNALHFMTLWMVRGQISKNRLVKFLMLSPRPKDENGCNSRSNTATAPALSTENIDDATRDSVLADALRMLVSDTHIMSSPLTKGFCWIAHIYFPLPAYIYLTQELAKHIDGPRASEAWDIMYANYEARSAYSDDDRYLFLLLSRKILEAWEAHAARCGTSIETTSTTEGGRRREGEEVMSDEVNEAAGEGPREPSLPVPKLVTLIRQLLAAAKSEAETTATRATFSDNVSHQQGVSTNTIPDVTAGRMFSSTAPSLDSSDLLVDMLWNSGGHGGWPQGDSLPAGVQTDAGFSNSTGIMGAPSLLPGQNLPVSSSMLSGSGADLSGWPPTSWTWVHRPA